MPHVSETSLLAACRILFGEEIDLGPEFLAYLQPSGVKAAYRARALEHHPDRFANQSPREHKRQTERFQEVSRAYHLLGTFLSRRQQHRPHPLDEPAFSRQPQRTAPAPGRPGVYPHPRVPATPLEFGLFLYHRGLITYQELIAALIWQRRQRPRLGAIARRWGWLDERAIQAILRSQQPCRRFGSRAVSLGYLNGTQLQMLLRFQRTQHRKLGQYFVEQGILGAAEVETLARELREHNRRVGDQSSAAARSSQGGR